MFCGFRKGFVIELDLSASLASLISSKLKDMKKDYINKIKKRERERERERAKVYRCF